MRMIFSVLGLLLVLAIVGVLARKQMDAGLAPVDSSGAQAAPAPAPKQQVQQYEKALQGAMQPARPMPEDEQ